MALVAAFAGPVLALNPIHESSYNLAPRGKFSASGWFGIAGILESRVDDFWKIPLSLALEAGPKVELGAGIKTQWGGASDDHVPYLVFGAKYMLTGATTLQGDLLLGANVTAGKGFSFGLHHREGHGRRLFSRFTGRVGFMEALVEQDALLALETAWYPTLHIVRPLSLEMGLIASSQTSDFNDHFALDLKPALQVHMGRESMVESAVTVGLAGERREDLRVQVTVIYAF
jgi:hypothetical protein